MERLGIWEIQSKIHNSDWKSAKTKFLKIPSSPSPKKASTYEDYVESITKFISQYEYSIQKQFTPAVIEDFYRQGKVIYFLRTNKVINWLPVGYASEDQIFQAGYFNPDGSPSITFNGDFQSNGVYFHCNSTSDLVKFEFIPVSFAAEERKIAESNKNDDGFTDKGFISLAEYRLVKAQLNEFINKPKSTKKIGQVKSPFVAVAVSANYDLVQRVDQLLNQQQEDENNGRITEEFVRQEIVDGQAEFGKILNVNHQFECHSVARNIQVQRGINVGVIEMGFTYAVEE